MHNKTKNKKPLRFEFLPIFDIPLLKEPFSELVPVRCALANVTSRNIDAYSFFVI